MNASTIPFIFTAFSNRETSPRNVQICQTPNGCPKMETASDNQKIVLETKCFRGETTHSRSIHQCSTKHQKDDKNSQMQLANPTKMQLAYRTLFNQEETKCSKLLTYTPSTKRPKHAFSQETLLYNSGDPEAQVISVNMSKK